MSHVVIWSGGVDSTALLYKIARVSCCGYPVRALTIERLHNINLVQMRMEKKARSVFLRFARRQGMHIKHEPVIIDGDCDPKNTSQPELWMCHLYPYFHDGEIVHFGYIKGDDFWHWRHVFEEAFGHLSSTRMKAPVLKFDYEWKKKWELLEYLRENKVPDDCWWSCEEIKRGIKPCGRCNKCEEIRVARDKLKRFGKKPLKRRKR